MIEQLGFYGGEEEQKLRFCARGVGWEGITTGTRICHSRSGKFLVLQVLSHLSTSIFCFFSMTRFKYYSLSFYHILMEEFSLSILYQS